MNAAKPKLVVAALVLATAAVTGGYFAWHWYTTGRYIEETDDGYVHADVVDVRPEIQGRITQVAVQDNQRVAAGDLLVQIDPADFKARLAQAKSQTGVARANVSEVKEQLQLQRQKVDKALATLDAARAEAHRAELELARARKLRKQSYSSQQELESAQATAEVTRARVTEAEAGLSAEKQQLTVLRARVTSANAALASALANQDFAASQLAKTRVVAHHAGVVGDVRAHPGAMASPGLSMMRLVPLPDVYILANYKETQITNMSVGQDATIHVDAFPGITFHGTIESLSPATGSAFSLLPRDNATGNFNKIVQRVPVKIRIEGPQNAIARLRPGLSVVTDIDTRAAGSMESYNKSTAASRAK